jgi:hypothetical protein
VSIYVSISRRADPLDAVGPAITADDWLLCVDEEPDFRPPVGAEAEWVGEHARVWAGHKYPVVFDLTCRGEIDVKSPDRLVIARMKALAAKLSANVFSEEGEIFDESGEHAGFLPDFPC